MNQSTKIGIFRLPFFLFPFVFFFSGFGVYIFSVDVLTKTTDIWRNISGAVVSFVLFSIFFWDFITQFKIIWIGKKGISAFLPFKIKKKQILWENLDRIECENFYGNHFMIYRKVTIISKEEKKQKIGIELTDRIFWNFNSLISAIPNGENLCKKINLKQAKEKRLTEIIIIIMLVWLLIYSLSNFSFNEIIIDKFRILVIFFSLVWLLISVKRLLRYIKIVRENKAEKQ